MKLSTLGILLVLSPIALAAQQIAGVENNYDARKLVQAAIQADQDLKPILANLNPRDWYEKKGAPSTYNLQWQTAQDELRYVEIAGNMVLQHVDSLPPLLDLYYRMEALELTARSLDQGAQQYAPRQDADKLDRWVGHGFEVRRRMREYIQDVATSLEQNFKIADEEAQRCRAAITKVPPATKRK
jgi:hypothetical protein